MKHRLISLRNIVQSLSKTMDLQRALAAAPIYTSWPAIVGTQVAEVTEPYSITGDTLLVSIVNSTWAQQLTLLKPKLLKAINNVLDSRVLLLRDIRFKVHGRPVTHNSHRTSYDTAVIRRITAYSPSPADISDAALRQTFTRFCNTYARTVSPSYASTNTDAARERLDNRLPVNTTD